MLSSSKLLVHLARDVELSNGQQLAEIRTAYRTLGQLDATHENVVLVLHGYTTGPSMLDPGANVAEGSWSELVGSGKAIDTDRYFVVCPNMLGSSYGSTGPSSLNPATRKSYGIDFPQITLEDIVDSQKRLLDSLGVKRLVAVVGPSFGGYQAFQWAVSYPDFVDRAVAAVSAPFNPAGVGSVESVRAQLSSIAGWNAGRYDHRKMLDGLTALRIVTLQRYGVEADLAVRFSDTQARTSALFQMARQWAEGFDPGSLITLIGAAEVFDLRPQLGKIRARLLMVPSRTDPVFNPALVAELAPLLDAAEVDWLTFELNSDKGHLASGADAHLWSDVLRHFLTN
jgi:homoserine O-acetyltransferase/O-succinyltransferase